MNILVKAVASGWLFVLSDRMFRNSKLNSVADKKTWAGHREVSIDPRSFFGAANRITDFSYARMFGQPSTQLKAEVKAKNEI
jgi:hypothetical protein